MFKQSLAASAALLTVFASHSAFAASDADIKALRAEINKMKEVYENRISELEAKLANVEQKQIKQNK